MSIAESARPAFLRSAVDPVLSANLDALRSEQVAGFYYNAVPGTVGSMFAAAILSGLLYHLGAISPWALITFNALVSGSCIVRFILIALYRRKQPPPEQWRRWGTAAVASALSGGIAWGSASILLMSPQVELQMLVFITCAAIAAGAITAFGTYPPSYYCNLISIMLPTVIWSTLQADPLHWTYALLGTLWIAIMSLSARTHGHILVRSLRLQFENLALANDLRRQKELAEEANTAKSRFLAAASHDLRQPVHAIEMFVGALGSQPMNTDSRRLVGQIKGSIDSLGGLFNSILDISRLDAGTIDVRPRAFQIQPLLERICREERGEADQKRVAVRLVSCGAVVRTDPVLLERILRNLISNAVRYTESGRIVVGCRRGERLSIEVWDTGPGISADKRDLIFQEFYQVGNPERSRSRGLGLGLAIVKRLSTILKTPLAFASTPGRGSAFKVSVPLAPANEVSSLAETGMTADVDVQRHLSILVVDDEPEIQAAMQALLSSWGHSVVAAGSGDEMVARIAALSRRPDLIISDYRLRGGENGLDTIRRVRGEFADDVPAILITGDTAPDRLREATASGCFLMHKPISNGRLRAAIMNLTNVAAG